MTIAKCASNRGSILRLAALLWAASVLALALPAADAGQGLPSLSRRWRENAFSSAVEPAAFKSPGAIHSGGLPFSFVYGGSPSASLVQRWHRTVVERKLSQDKSLRVLTLSDPETGLEIRAEAICYADTGGVDWTVYFTNRGTKDTPILEQIQAVDVTVRPRGQQAPVLHRLNGSTSALEDWLPLEDTLALGKAIEFGPYGEQANSSSGACPFFNLQWDGGGVITALGWTAPWLARVERDLGGAVRLQAGMRQTHLRLHPGETIRSPRILQLYWSRTDAQEACNQFRRVMFAHILPRREGQLVAPPIAHGVMSDSETNVLSHLDAMRGLGFEVFWLDAYWHRDGYPKGAGHYGFPIQRVEPPDRFPHGLAPVGEAIHKDGLQFLVWFSPESPWAGSELTREHPEWVICWEKDKPLWDWCQLDLGIPEAREFMTRYLLTVIREYGIDWLRLDCGMLLSYCRCQNQKNPERIGMAEIRYVEAIYRMWDEIRAAYPRLAIDNCYGGGRRIDLETCARSLPLWRTDVVFDYLTGGKFEQAALLNQSMTAGLSQYVPFSLCGQGGSAPYFFRSGYNAGVLSCDDARPADYPRGQLREGIAEIKRLRKYYFGDFYPLTPVTTNAADWCVLQYNRPAQEDGMLLAFRRHQATHSEMVLQPRGLRREATYEVTSSYGYQAAAPPMRVKGSELEQLRVAITNCPGSVLIEYRRRR